MSRGNETTTPARTSLDGIPARPAPAPLRTSHRLEYAAFRAASALLTSLPESWALRLGAGLGWFAGAVLRLRRDVVDAHLALAFPERPPSWRRRVARASWTHLGREAVTLFRAGRLDHDQVLERTGEEHGLEALVQEAQMGKGVVLVSGHLGSWEMGAAALAARGLEVDAVAKPMANPAFDRDLVESRARLGLRIVDTSRAPREVLRSLRAGRVAGLVADQNTHRDPVFVPFFGVPAATSRGPALFALRTGAPLFFGYALRIPGPTARYSLHVERVEVPRTGNLERDVRALTEAHTRALEHAVRACPEQYFWQHKRWKTRPDGTDGLPPRGS